MKEFKSHSYYYRWYTSTTLLSDGCLRLACRASFASDPRRERPLPTPRVRSCPESPERSVRSQPTEYFVAGLGVLAKIKEKKDFFRAPRADLLEWERLGSWLSPGGVRQWSSKRARKRKKGGSTGTPADIWTVILGQPL